MGPEEQEQPSKLVSPQRGEVIAAPEADAVLAPPLANSLPLATQEPRNELHALTRRIGQELTPINEAIVLTRLREEIVKQEEFRKNQSYLRTSETRQFYGKMAFSAGGVLGGLALVFTGHPLEGFAVMGAGFHWLAPDYVNSVWKRIVGRRGEGESDEE